MWSTHWNLLMSRITEKLEYSSILWLKLFVPSNSMQISISCYYSLGRHTSMMQYEKQIINGEANLCWIFSVMKLEIHWPRERDWGPIDWFNPGTFLCLSQARTCISNAIWHGYYFGSMIWYERWLFVFV